MSLTPIQKIQVYAAIQLDRAKGARTGYGKCLNVNERVLSALPDTEERFAFGVWNIGEVRPQQPGEQQQGAGDLLRQSTGGREPIKFLAQRQSPVYADSQLHVGTADLGCAFRMW